MKQKCARLINVKSIVTIMITLVFCILSVLQKISAEQFMTVFATVIAFYFGTQHQKNTSEIVSENRVENQNKNQETE